MLGFLSQDTMAAVSLAGQVQFVFSLFVFTMTAGTSIFAAQYWGKGDKDAVERLVGIVYRITIPVSLCFTLSTALIPSLLMKIFTPDPVLIGYGAEYLRAVSLSYLFCGASQIYMCVMKNSERVFKASLISSVCVVVNILLNGVLIFGLFGLPKLGGTGAAIATVIARAIELVWALSDSAAPDRIKMKKEYFLHIDKPLRKDFWKYTSPVFGNELVWGLGYTMGTVIVGRLGTDAVAASAIAVIAKNLSVCFIRGISAGAGIMVGNELGAGNLEKAKAYGERLLKTAIVSGIVTGAFLLLISPLIISITTLTPAATAYLKWMIAICALSIVGKAINATAIIGLFCAGGDSKFGFACDSITLWAVIVPLGLLAAFVWHLPVLVVYFIISADEIIKIPAVLLHYKKYRWVKNLTK